MVTAWKIAPGRKASGWKMCRDQGCIALGWRQLTDYQKYKTEKEILAALGGGKGDGKGAANSIWRFANVIQSSHRVVANNGKSRVEGIGIVTSDYLPPNSAENPNPDQSSPCSSR